MKRFVVPVVVESVYEIEVDAYDRNEAERLAEGMNVDDIITNYLVEQRKDFYIEPDLVREI